MGYKKNEKNQEEDELTTFLWELLFYLECCVMGTIVLKTFAQSLINIGLTVPGNLYFGLLLIFWVAMYIITMKYIIVKPKDLLVMLIAVVLVALACYFISTGGKAFHDVLDIINS